MREAAGVLDLKWILRITLQRGLREKLGPPRFCCLQPLALACVRRRTAQIAGLERKLFRIVSLEETRVHHDAANDSRHTESDDAPVVAGSAAAPSLPSVHPFAARGVFVLDKNRGRWLKQILFRREKFVVGQEHTAAQAF